MTDAGPDRIGAQQAGAGWGWMLAYGVLSAILGSMALFSPLSATLAATWVVGSFLLAVGIVSIVAGAQARGHHHRGYGVVFGILTAIVGVLAVLRPFGAALSITLLVAGWLFARGILEVAYAFRHQRQRVAMIIMGIVNVLLALWIVATIPLSAITLPGYLLGFSLLLGGVTSIMAALAHRRGAPSFPPVR